MTHVPAYAGALLFVIFVLVIVLNLDGAERRRASCSGCRQEALGSRWPYLEHTCSKRRAKYRDRRGRLWIFGKKVG